MTQLFRQYISKSTQLNLTVAERVSVDNIPRMGSELLIRLAKRSDLEALIALYADDDLGMARESGEPDDRYLAAFEAIDGDPNHLLAVGEMNSEIVATLLLSFLPGLSRHGAWRAQIEAMRVARAMRGHGLGKEMLDWAVQEASARNCDLVQLTSDRQRPDAHRFYEKAGFSPSHVGFKLFLDER